MRTHEFEVQEAKFLPPMSHLSITPGHFPVRRDIDPEQLAAMADVSNGMLRGISTDRNGNITGEIEVIDGISQMPGLHDLPVMEGGIGIQPVQE